METVLNKANLKKWGNRPEWAVIIIYAVAWVVIGIYHEPWFDEVQALQIAKCASLSEVLFSIPHLEGHPPLWHLILAVPARLGVPFEVGLRLAGFLISVGSVILIELKAPFPRWIRLLLPFNYFIFYQYGVIVRPYSLMLLAFICTAMTFENRDEKPGRFIIALAFLCSTMAYGIVFAGGIAACWLYDVFLDNNKEIRSMLRDRRVYWMGGLLIFALILISMIIPQDNAVAFYNEGDGTPLIVCLICTLTTFLSNTFITTSGWMSTDNYKLQNAPVYFDSVFPAVIGDLLLWSLLVSFSSKKKLKYLVVPYVLFCLFAGVVYFQSHHVGTAALFLLFWIWINLQDEERFEIGWGVLLKLCRSDKEQKQFKKLAVGGVVLCLLIPAFWSIRSSILEIKNDYWFSRNAAEFLRGNQLAERTIAGTWYEQEDCVNESGDVDYGKIQTYYAGEVVPVVAYYENNIVYTLNHGKDDKAYCIHRIVDAETNRRNVEQWRAKGAPEVLIGKVDVELLTNGEFSLNDYIPVYCCPYGKIWKGNIPSQGRLYIFVRGDVAEELHISRMDLPEGMRNDLLFAIGDEVKEAYEKGEDYQAILDEQFDYLLNLNNE